MHRTKIIAAITMVAITCTAAAETRTVTVKVTQDECANVVRHQPDADVAYRPGVDVDGNSVAPADLNGGQQLRVPEEIVIPIKIDLQDRFKIPANKQLFEADANVGVVTWRDGKAWFNGQALQSDDEAALIAACRRLRREGR